MKWLYAAGVDVCFLVTVVFGISMWRSAVKGDVNSTLAVGCAFVVAMSVFAVAINRWMSNYLQDHLDDE